jgi:hypothetical protein
MHHSAACSYWQAPPHANERRFESRTWNPVSILRLMGSETFRRNWRGWARSSEGYAVRLLGRTDLQYSDEFGDLNISAEAMSKPWTDIVVYTATIPDRPDRPRAEVLSRLRRAFDFRGWNLIEEHD